MSFGLVAVFVTVASVAYNYSQQRKAKKKAEEARKKAEAAEDARKGFEITVEGKVKQLPLVYGRAKIGGVRVAHAVRSQVNLSGNSADKRFNNGLGYSDDPTKNEYLFFQQAISKRELSKVYDIEIDDTYKINDSKLSKGKSAILVDIHYGYDTGTGSSKYVSCDFMSRNVYNRSTSRFTGASYLSCCIRTDRDEPVFSSVPSIKLYVEGVRIHGIQNGALTDKTYSNNPARVLLDYLYVEKKVPLENIDLHSFESARILCDTIVQHNTPVGGSIWQPTDQSRSIKERDLPLYECNLIIDTAKPFRENVEAILGTMGDARLVWSQGKYKLRLQYPEIGPVGNEEKNVDYVDTVTEDRLILGEPIDITWPTTEERLNHCTIRFANESEEFKNDTVSWPPKPDDSHVEGVGATLYNVANGNWDAFPAGRFLSDYAVWEGLAGSPNFVWKIRPEVTGDYVLRFVADKTGSITLNGITLNDTNSDWEVKKTQTYYASIHLVAGTVYDITGSATSDNAQRAGFAATLEDSNGVQVWNTKDPSYTDFITINSDFTVYNQFLAEDNYVPLESDTFLEGATTYQHALAKCEENVRMSRTATTIKFTYALQGKYPEPGDILRVKIKDIDINDYIFIKIDKITLKSNEIGEVEGNRFFVSQLAWNVPDNYYPRPTRIFDTTPLIPMPMWVKYKFDTDTDITNSAGQIRWATIYDSRVVKFNIYYTTDVNNTANWILLGTVEQGTYDTSNPADNVFDLPDLSLPENVSIIFGVRSVTKSGDKSAIQITSTVNISRLKPPEPINATVEEYGQYGSSARLTWVIPPTRSDGTNYRNHLLTRIYCGTSNVFIEAQLIGESSIEEAVLTPVIYGELYFWLVCVSQANVSSNETLVGPIFINYKTPEGVIDLTPPKAPLNFVISKTMTTAVLAWGAFNDDWSNISVTEIYRNTVNDLNSATHISSVKGSLYSDKIGYDKTYFYWIKFTSRTGVEGAWFSTSGVGVTTGESVTDIKATLSKALTQNELSNDLMNVINSNDQSVTIAEEKKIRETTTGPDWSPSLYTPKDTIVVYDDGSGVKIYKRLPGKPDYDSVWTPTNWTEVTDSPYGEWTIKVNNEGKVVGMGLASDGPGNASDDMIIMADKLAIMEPMSVWKANTAYSIGELVLPKTANSFMYKVTIAGSSGSIEPTWSTTVNSTTYSDSSLEFICLNKSPKYPFIFDTNTGKLHVDSAFIGELSSTNFVSGKITADNVKSSIKIETPRIESGKHIFGEGSGVLLTSDGAVDIGDSSEYIRRDTSGSIEIAGKVNIKKPDSSLITLDTISDTSSKAFETIDTIVSDEIFSISEKATWRKDWANISSIYDKTVELGTQYGIQNSADFVKLLSSKTNLYNYLDAVPQDIWDNNGSSGSSKNTPFYKTETHASGTYDIPLDGSHFTKESGIDAWDYLAMTQSHDTGIYVTLGDFLSEIAIVSGGNTLSSDPFTSYIQVLHILSDGSGVATTNYNGNSKTFNLIAGTFSPGDQICLGFDSNTDSCYLWINDFETWIAPLEPGANWGTYCGVCLYSSNASVKHVKTEQNWLLQKGITHYTIPNPLLEYEKEYVKDLQVAKNKLTDYAHSAHGIADNADYTKKVLEDGTLVVNGGGFVLNPPQFDINNRKYVYLDNGTISINYRIGVNGDYNNSANDVPYEVLTRQEFGEATNNTWTQIPGYFLSQPNVFLMPKHIKSYVSGGTSQTLTFNFDVAAYREIDPSWNGVGSPTEQIGSMVWAFKPYARLLGTASTSSATLNSLITSPSSDTLTQSPAINSNNSHNVSSATKLAVNLTAYSYRKDNVFNVFRRKVNFTLHYKQLPSGTYNTVSTNNIGLPYNGWLSTTKLSTPSLSAAIYEWYVTASFSDNGIQSSGNSVLTATASYPPTNRYNSSQNGTSWYFKMPDGSTPWQTITLVKATAVFLPPPKSTIPNLQSYLNSGYSITTTVFTFSSDSFVLNANWAETVYFYINNVRVKYLSGSSINGDTVNVSSQSVTVSGYGGFNIREEDSANATWGTSALLLNTAKLSIVVNLQKHVNSTASKNNQLKVVSCTYDVGALNVVDPDGICSYIAVGK